VLTENAIYFKEDCYAKEDERMPRVLQKCQNMGPVMISVFLLFFQGWLWVSCTCPGFEQWTGQPNSYL